MDTGSSQDDTNTVKAATNGRSPSPPSINTLSEQAHTKWLPRPEPLKPSSLMASLPQSSLNDNRPFQGLAGIPMYSGISPSPAMSTTSSRSENPSPASTPIPNMDDSSKASSDASSAANVMRRGSKVTRVM